MLMLQAAQRRVAFALALNSGAAGAAVTDADVIATVGARVVGVGQAVAWERKLSHEHVRFDDGDFDTSVSPDDISVVYDAVASERGAGSSRAKATSVT